MVIDFGVAKATGQKLTEKTLFTNFATMIGTPAYMSPEQAEMSKLDVDTPSRRWLSEAEAHLARAEEMFESMNSKSPVRGEPANLDRARARADVSARR